MERPIDFSRDRSMHCAGCGAEFVVDLDWIDRWERKGEACPRCKANCDEVLGPKVTVCPSDPALNTERIARFFWYHTSTYADWPSNDFCPVKAQRGLALHVGTYEAAVHNMLRTLARPSDSDRQFYLYRVRLRPDVVVREDWLIDPSDAYGDVVLTDVCPPGVDVARYLNYHEDPGGISLVFGRDAIASVQQVTLPLSSTGWDEWMRHAVDALENASDDPVPVMDVLGRLRQGSSQRMSKGDDLAADLAGRLPINLREEFERAITFTGEMGHQEWVSRAVGLINVIENPQHVLSALDSAEVSLR